MQIWPTGIVSVGAILVCSIYINIFAGICICIKVEFCKILLDFSLQTMAPAIDSPDSFEFDGNVVGGQEPPPEDNDARRSEFPVFRLRNRLTALVIDNNICCRLLQKGMLQHYGVVAEDVESGEAAMELISKRQEQFDLIIIDSSLTFSYNGLDDITAMRARGVTSKVVGMIMCWCEPVQDDNMCGCLPEIALVLEAGASEVIFKPLHPQTLVAILRDLDNQI